MTISSYGYTGDKLVLPLKSGKKAAYNFYDGGLKIFGGTRRLTENVHIFEDGKTNGRQDGQKHVTL